MELLGFFSGFFVCWWPSWPLEMKVLARFVVMGSFSCCWFGWQKWRRGRGFRVCFACDFRWDFCDRKGSHLVAVHWLFWR